jgi:hypothetical protein
MDGSHLTSQQPKQHHIHALPPHANGRALPTLFHESQLSEHPQRREIAIQCLGGDPAHAESLERFPTEEVRSLGRVPLVPIARVDPVRKALDFLVRPVESPQTDPTDARSTLTQDNVEGEMLAPSVLAARAGDHGHGVPHLVLGVKRGADRHRRSGVAKAAPQIGDIPPRGQTKKETGRFDGKTNLGQPPRHHRNPLANALRIKFLWGPSRGSHGPGRETYRHLRSARGSHPRGGHGPVPGHARRPTRRWSKWTGRDLNPRPLVCKTSDLPD